MLNSVALKFSMIQERHLSALSKDGPVPVVVQTIAKFIKGVWLETCENQKFREVFDVCKTSS